MSKATRKVQRTTFLGVAAMAALIWSAIDQFGISPETMLNLFLAVVVAVVIIVIFAGLVTLLWVGLRSLARRR